MGAWIETQYMAFAIILMTVALHAGAWIETTPLPPSLHPPRVALHVGAWIETYFTLLLDGSI